MTRRHPEVPGSGDAMRIDGNVLSTAVRTFAHPRTARVVTLVGTMHIGKAEYFASLSEVVEGLAGVGAEVHVEGISDRDEESSRGWERCHLAAAYSWAHPETTGAATVLGVESQVARLRLPDGARNIDLSHVELLRRVGWGNYRRFFAPPLTEPSRGRRLMRGCIAFELRHRRGLNRLRSLRPGHRKVNQVVIQHRNRIAFAGAVEALTARDVVLVWGADHVPGLARMLALQGYHLSREEWFPACAI